MFIDINNNIGLAIASNSIGGRYSGYFVSLPINRFLVAKTALVQIFAIAQIFARRR